MPPPPGQWTTAELTADAAASQAAFVKQRLAALATEQGVYAAAHKELSKVADRLLNVSSDLRNLSAGSLQDRAVFNFARQLAVPPISLDDMDAITGSVFGQWQGQKTNKGISPTPADFAAAAKLISDRLDTDRMPWVAANRAPTTSERQLFVEWSAAAPAVGRVLTHRRITASTTQEEDVRKACAAAGYKPVSPAGALNDPVKQMPPGTYTTAARKLDGRSLDCGIRLRANHPTGLLFIASEQKSSSSFLNSVKRGTEVLAKASTWTAAGTAYQFRTMAVLAGLWSVHRLEEMQNAGIYIIWSHRLTDLTNFL